MKTTKEEVAAMKARLDHMEKRQEDLFDILKDIKTSTDEHKGARKALHAVYIVVVSLVTLKFGDITALFTNQ